MDSCSWILVMWRNMMGDTVFDRKEIDMEDRIRALEKRIEALETASEKEKELIPEDYLKVRGLV